MQTRRNTRHPVELAGRYSCGRGPARTVAVLDLSSRGCRLAERFPTLRVGSHISLQIAANPPIPARVRWRLRSDVGVEFLHAIDPRGLA